MIRLAIREDEWVEYTAYHEIVIRAELVTDIDGKLGKYGAIYCDGEFEGYVPSSSGVTYKVLEGKEKGGSPLCLCTR